MKIGITGQSGFVGTHLYNYLGLQDGVERVPFEDDIFKSESQLQEWVQQCDVIVHLAALNRHNDPDIIYRTNVDLVNKLVSACESTESKPHILFSSSTQEERDNLYGKSKRDGRLAFEKWADNSNARFTGLIIPNVFGPFGHPYYNSFIATFCHQLTHNEQPEIHVDGEVKLIYVGELVEEIYNRIISNDVAVTSCQIPHTKEIKVSEVLSLLNSYKTNYFDNGIFPSLAKRFETNLFNTFVCYIDHKEYFPRRLTLHTDNRGSFVETSKVYGGQNSFSTTVPGITRGNHYHLRKAERFTVIKGKATIELRRIGTDEVLTFELDGDTQPAYVDMPVWYTHNITNIGEDVLYTVFWISEHYNSEDGDTYFEPVSVND